MPPARFPNLTELSEEMTSGDGEQRFWFAIDVFLDGLVARAGPAGGGPLQTGPPGRSHAGPGEAVEP